MRYNFQDTKIKTNRIKLLHTLRRYRIMICVCIAYAFVQKFILSNLKEILNSLETTVLANKTIEKKQKKKNSERGKKKNKPEKRELMMITTFYKCVTKH